MEAIPKSDIKSDIRFGNRCDIRIKQTTWIGHNSWNISHFCSDPHSTGMYSPF